MQRVRCRVRRNHYSYRGCRGWNEGRRRYLHRCMGIHGRACLFCPLLTLCYKLIIREIFLIGAGYEIKTKLGAYKVTRHVMENAGEKAIFLHCLPAFHDLKTKIGKEMGERFNLTDMEVTDEVFESPQSKVFDEAENRMHTIKAVIVATLGEPEK